jgi:hypothetical protein
MRPCRKGWHRFQASFRWVFNCTFWRLDFRQSGFGHITRVSRPVTPYAWARRPGWLACDCSLSLSRPGKPLDPGMFPPIPPYWVGDITERLVAQHLLECPHWTLSQPRRLRQVPLNPAAGAGTGFRRLSGGRTSCTTGDWASGNPAFAISHGSLRLLAPHAWAREPDLNGMLLSPFSFESR